MKEKIVKQCDLTVFDGRLSYMRPAMQLLNVLVCLRDSDNTLKANVKTLVEAMSDANRKVSERTMRGWLMILAQNGAIKYKYGGKIIVNPLYVFNGSLQAYNSTVSNWNAFRSDVAPYDASFVLI